MYLILRCSDSSGSWTTAAELVDGAELVVGNAPGIPFRVNAPGLAGRTIRFLRRGERVRVDVMPAGPPVRLAGRSRGRAELAAGDLVALGGWSLQIVDALPLAPPDESLPRSDASPRAGASAELGAAAEAGASAKTGRDGRPTLDWEAFEGFLDTLRKAVAPRHLLERLLSGIVAHLQADRGFVLIRDGESWHTVADHRIVDVPSFVAVSRSVTDRVLADGRSLHVENSSRDDRFRSSASIAHYPRPRSIVCAPLRADAETFGVIYCDRPCHPDGFSPESLALVETVTRLASQILANGQTRLALGQALDRLRGLEEAGQGPEGFYVGDGEAGRRMKALVERAAAQDVTVLLRGETGTGKERIARALHGLSSRRKGPFVAIHCAALPEGLIEAELFGVVAGAFTGAKETRPGRLEMATGGTLFLDEVGDIPLALQAKLLRVLQERRLTRLGDETQRELDFRLVAATHVDLEAAIRKGDFREDLYYRLAVFPVVLTPLRERREEILPLARRFLRSFSMQMGKEIEDFDEEARRILTDHDWPGNVRELRNAVERAVVIETDGMVRRHSLPLLRRGLLAESAEDGFWADLPTDFDGCTEAFHRLLIRRALARAKGNASEAARRLGVARSTLYRHMEKLGLIPGQNAAETKR